MDNNNIVTSEDIVTLTQASSNSNVSDTTSVPSTSRSAAGTSITPAVILASSSYTFPIDYPDSPSSEEMASPSLSPHPSYETKVDTTLEQQSDTQALESESVESYQQTDTKPDTSSERDTQTLESESVESYQQTDTKPDASSEPDTQALESESVESYQQTDTKPDTSSERDTQTLESESVESYQQTDTKPDTSSERDTQTLESESVESYQQTDTKPDTSSERDTQTLESESVESYQQTGTKPDTSSERDTQTLESEFVESHLCVDTEPDTSSEPYTQTQITDTSVVASTDPDTQAHEPESIALTEMHQIADTSVVASADPDIQACRSISLAPVEMHQVADTIVTVLADTDPQAYDSESGAPIETHQITHTCPGTSNIQDLESESEVMETSHIVTTDIHFQDNMTSVPVDEMIVNETLVSPVYENSSVAVEVSSTSNKDKDENDDSNVISSTIKEGPTSVNLDNDDDDTNVTEGHTEIFNVSFESASVCAHVLPISSTTASSTSEMAASEDIVNTSEMAASEDIVNTSEMAVSEDIVNTSEMAVSEDIVNTSEMAASEDIVNTSNMAASEDIVNTSEMAPSEDIVNTSEMAVSEDIVNTSEMAPSEDIVNTSNMAASEDIVNTSEMAPSEDIVNTSEMAVSEDIVNTSEMAASEDIVNTSEMAPSEDIVNTSEMVASEDIVNTLNMATSEDIVNTSEMAPSEDIVNTSEMASAGLDRDSDVILVPSMKDTPCYSNLTQEPPVNDSNTPDIINYELTTLKDIPDSSIKEYDDTQISNVTFFNDSSHSVTSSTQSDHIHNMLTSYPLTPNIAEASTITTDSCTTILEDKRDMMTDKTEEGTTFSSETIETTVDSQSEVKMLPSNPKVVGVLTNSVDNVETNVDFVTSPEESRDSQCKEEKTTCTTEDGPKESGSVADDVVSQEGIERSIDSQHEEEAAGVSTFGDNGDVQESFSSPTVPRNNVIFYERSTNNVRITSKMEATSDNQNEDEHLMTEAKFPISPEKMDMSTVSREDESLTSKEKKSEPNISEKTGSAVSVTEQTISTTTEEEMEYKNSDSYKDVIKEPLVNDQDVFSNAEDQTVNSNIVSETPLVESEDTLIKQEPKVSVQHEKNPKHPKVESSSDDKALISSSSVITDRQESTLPPVTDNPPSIVADKTHQVPSEESLTPLDDVVTTSSGSDDFKQVLFTSEVGQHDNIVPVQATSNSSSYGTKDDDKEQAMDTEILLETENNCEDEHMETEEQQFTSSTEISPTDYPSHEQQKTSLQSLLVASPIDSSLDKIQSSITIDILTTSREEDTSKQTKTDLTESVLYVHTDLIKSQPRSTCESIVNPDPKVQMSTTTDQSTKLKDDLSTTSTFGNVIMDTENTNIEEGGCHVSQSMKSTVLSVEHEKGPDTETETEHEKGPDTEMILKSTQLSEELSPNVTQDDLRTEPTEDQSLVINEEKEQKRTIECQSSPSKSFHSSQMLHVVRSENVTSDDSQQCQVGVNKNNVVENIPITVLSKNGSALQSKTGTSSNEMEPSVLTSSPSTLSSVPVTKTTSLSFLLSSPHLPSSHTTSLKSTSKPVSTTCNSMSLVSSLPSFSAITASPISLSLTSSHFSTISTTLSSTAKPVTAPTSDSKLHATTIGSLAKSHTTVSSVHRVPVVAERSSPYRKSTPVTSTLRSLMRNQTSDPTTSTDKSGHDAPSISSIVVMTQSSSEVLPSFSIPQVISTTSSVSLANKDSKSNLSGQTEQTSLSGERDTTSPVKETEPTSQSGIATSAHLSESIKTDQARQTSTTATMQPPSLFSVSVTPYTTTPTSVISAPTVTIPEGVPGGLVSDISVKDEMEVSDVDKVTAQQLKLAQQKLAMLQRHSFSSLYKSTDVVSSIVCIKKY